MGPLGVVCRAVNLGVSWWNQIVSSPMAEVIPHPTFAAKSPPEKVLWILRQDYPKGMTPSEIGKRTGLDRVEINEVLNDLVADQSVKMAPEYGNTFVAAPPNKSEVAQ